MRDSTTQYSRIFYWMTLSVLVHGIAVSWLPLPQSSAKPLIEERTLWVSAWRDTAAAAPIMESAVRHPPARFQPPLASNDVPPAKTHSPPITPIRGEPSPTGNTVAMPEDKLASHMLGLIHRSIQEHFVYPPFAQKQGWEGEVLVALQLSAEGEISDIRVVRSSGYRILDDDALLILRKIGSIPNARAWLGGRNYRARIPVIYRLTG